MNTTNFNWPLPTVGASADQWGSILNSTLELVDLQVKAIADSVPAPVNLTPYALLTGGQFTGAIIAPSFTGVLTGNAATASAWQTARTLTLGGVVSGSITFDGSADGSLILTMPDNALTIAKTAGLQAELDSKEPTLAANRKLQITFGTADPSGTPADGDIYLQHDP